MKNGDISNHSAPYIAFDLDSLMFAEPERKSFKDRLSSILLSERKWKERQGISENFANTLRRLWNNHDVSIILLTCYYHEDDLEELADKLDRNLVPFSHLYNYTEWESIRRTLHLYTYLFSANNDLISFLSADNVKNISEIGKVLRV
ncbi:hypothetical protein D1872_81160 [compost metagenome]